MVAKKLIFIRVKPNEFNSKSWNITVQVQGFPESVGYLDDDLSGLYGSRSEMYKLANELRSVEAKNNPDAKVVVLKD